MTVLAAVSLRLIIGVYRLLPLWQNSWCPLQPHCPAPSPARTQVGRHQAPLCVDPSPRQLATEVGTAQHGQQQHRLDLNAGLLQYPGIAAAPHGSTTILPASPHPHPKSSPVRYPGACVSLPEAKLGWDGSGRDTGSPQQGVPQALRGSTAMSGVAVRGQLLCRLMTRETALIQHNTHPSVPRWNGKYQLCPRSPTLEF